MRDQGGIQKLAIGNLFWRYLPHQLFLLAFLADVTFRTSWGVPCFSWSFSPALYHSILYAWIVQHPDALPLPFLFCLSVAKDAAWGRPVGQTFLELFVLTVVVISQRLTLIRSSFWVAWAFFSFCLALFSVLPLLFCSGAPQGRTAALASWGWITFSYPFFHLLFQKSVLKGEGADARSLS